MRTNFRRVANHVEQRLRLLNAIDSPIRIENFMAAMLGIRLRKHHQFDIRWIAVELRKCLR